jgi:hypothetical protein
MTEGYNKRVGNFAHLQWSIRIISFIIFLLPMLFIKNKFFMNDEYWFAVTLDKGEYAFHNFHILSNYVVYLVWSLATLVGIKISAFYAAQLSSSILSAVGAAALIDLGMFWGLSWRNSMLFSLPIILCNAFIRYGTSAYPGAMAMGVGLIAVNLTIRASVYFELHDRKIWHYFFWAGFFVGLASLIHLAFLAAFPGLLCGLLLAAIMKQDFLNVIKPVLLYCFGVFISLVIPYLFLPLVARFFPNQVAYTGAQEQGILFSILTGQLPKWLPSFKDFITCLKTHIALFIPGVHSKNFILNSIFQVPRVLAFFMFVYFVSVAWRNRRANFPIFLWGLTTLIIILFEFLFILFSGISQCRQYVVISLSVFGPFFLSVFILSYNKRRYVRVLISIFTASLLFYSVFGIEGVVQIITHDNRQMLKLYRHCDIHTPKSVQLPWLVDRSAQNPLCHVESNYGAFGPGLDYLNEDVEK